MVRRLPFSKAKKIDLNRRSDAGGKKDAKLQRFLEKSQQFERTYLHSSAKIPNNEKTTKTTRKIHILINEVKVTFME